MGSPEKGAARMSLRAACADIVPEALRLGAPVPVSQSRAKQKAPALRQKASTPRLGQSWVHKKAASLLKKAAALKPEGLINASLCSDVDAFFINDAPIWGIHEPCEGQRCVF
ncbi:hypothetical protein ACN9M1_15480 [Ralstonia sp. R-29]|uniref:hypothetical protein n=1 Tax=Ralstonia sp. R-29 TaxID=3404059 RepID=UPI003CF35A38